MSAPASDPFADLLEANDAYAERFSLGHLEATARRGLALITCMDSRIEPLAMLGLEPGDAKIMRNAGARVGDDVIRTLDLAIRQLGVDRIALVIHTECAGGMPTEEQTAARALEDAQRLRAAPEIPDATPIGVFRYDVRSGRLERLA